MNALETALYSRLTGGTALTALLHAGTASVYNQVVPHGASLPYVVFQLQGGGDENMTPTRSRNLVYTIKAVGETGPADAGAIDIQIDALMHNKPVTVTGWGCYWCAREGAISYAEVTAEGNVYTHTGALYRIRLSQ